MANNSEEGWGSQRAVMPVMMMMMNVQQKQNITSQNREG
jgi:hypothetical protein